MWEIWKSTSGTFPHLGRQPSVVEMTKDKVTHKMVCRLHFAFWRGTWSICLYSWLQDKRMEDKNNVSGFEVRTELLCGL